MTKNSHFLNKSELTFWVGSLFYTTFAPEFIFRLGTLNRLIPKQPQKAVFDIMKRLLIMATILTSMVLASCNVTRPDGKKTFFIVHEG